jgi:hypothetical protein
MKKWSERAADIASEFPGVLRDVSAPATEMPKIFKPIDAEVDNILRTYEKAALFYNPLRVEDLYTAFMTRLNFCVEAREKAQQLDNEAFRETTDIMTRRLILDSMDTQLGWTQANEPQMLRNQIKLKYSGNEVTAGPPLDPDFWKKTFEAQGKQLNAMRDELVIRVARLEESMGAGAYVDRFKQILKVFTVDIIAAYMMARSLWVASDFVYGGLKSEKKIGEVPAATKEHFLDELILWAKKFGDAYQETTELVRFATAIIPLHLGDETPGPSIRLMGLKAFSDGLISGSFHFELTSAQLSALAVTPGATLRGVDVWTTGTDQGTAPSGVASSTLFRARIHPPEQSRDIAPFNTALDAMLPPIRDLSLLDFNSEMSVPRQMYDIRPLGTWGLTFDPKGARGELLNSFCKNLFLRMRFMYLAA